MRTPRWQREVQGAREEQVRGWCGSLTDLGCRVTAVGRGTLDQLETELLENGTILGVMGGLVQCVVAYHALLAAFFATSPPA